MDQISYKLDVFEGPMDLLLSLIAKHKLNIYDIPIVELVDQYLDYVRRMQDEDMYVAIHFYVLYFDNALNGNPIT